MSVSDQIRSDVQCFLWDKPCVRGLSCLSYDGPSYDQTGETSDTIFVCLSIVQLLQAMLLDGWQLSEPIMGLKLGHCEAPASDGVGYAQRAKTLQICPNWPKVWERGWGWSATHYGSGGWACRLLADEDAPPSPTSSSSRSIKLRPRLGSQRWLQGAGDIPGRRCPNHFYTSIHQRATDNQRQPALLLLCNSVRC